MIIFYNKITGQITATIEGRHHPEHHLDMFIGDPKSIGRLIIGKVGKDQRATHHNMHLWNYQLQFEKPGNEITQHRVLIDHLGQVKDFQRIPKVNILHPKLPLPNNPVPPPHTP